MEKISEQRLVGAAVMILLGVIFIPMILAPPEQAPTQGDEPFIVLAPPPEPGKAFAPPIEPMDKVGPPAQNPSPPVARSRASTTATATAMKDSPEKSPEPQEIKQEKGEGNTLVIDRLDNRRTASGANDRATTISPPVNVKADGDPTAWAVQIGSFAKRQNALDRERYLRKKGYRAFVESANGTNEGITRVLVGPRLLRKEAARVAEKLRLELGMEGLVLRYP